MERFSSPSHGKIDELSQKNVRSITHATEGRGAGCAREAHLQCSNTSYLGPRRPQSVLSAIFGLVARKEFTPDPEGGLRPGRLVTQFLLRKIQISFSSLQRLQSNPRLFPFRCGNGLEASGSTRPARTGANPSSDIAIVERVSTSGTDENSWRIRIRRQTAQEGSNRQA